MYDLIGFNLLLNKKCGVVFHNRNKIANMVLRDLL